MEKYGLVFRHDRAGRLVDAQSFEHLKFDACCFSEDLLMELNHPAGIISLCPPSATARDVIDSDPPFFRQEISLLRAGALTESKIGLNFSRLRHSFFPMPELPITGL